MDTFQEFFEDAAPRWIASAWDFTGRSPAIDMVWVYMTNEDNAHGTGAYYRVGDRYYKPNDLDQALPGLDTSNEAVLVMYRELMEITDEGDEGIRDRSTIPTRTILRFRPADGDFSADFHYGPLQPGIPADEQLFDTDVADAWFARLKETGNDSAAP